MEILILIVILAAQVYSIVRSETLLHRERELHKKIEEHLAQLTPAGLWLQYEHLKKFYEEAAEELKKTRHDLVKAQLREINQKETVNLLMETYATTQRILDSMLTRLSKGQNEIASLSPSPSASPSVGFSFGVCVTVGVGSDQHCLNSVNIYSRKLHTVSLSAAGAFELWRF